MRLYTADLAKYYASQSLSKALRRDFGLSEIRYPPENISGDLSFPCFPLAKEMKKSPQMIASELKKEMAFGEDNLIDRVESAAGYLNFFLNEKRFCARVIEDFLELEDGYGQSDMGQKKKVVVDFSSPNIAKPFSIGHLRSTNIGSALCNILKFAGYEVIGDNHLGDWGTQFGKLIYAYRMWGDKKLIEADPIPELLKLYTRFHQEAGASDEEDQEGQANAKTDSHLLDEARAYFKKLEEKDPETVYLWEWFREVSLKDFQRIYDMLGVKFDHVLGESFYNDKMDSVKTLAQSKGILEKDEKGTLLVRLDDYGISTPLLIQKMDGTSLYATRDLACAVYRVNEWNPEKLLYVVGEEQQLYFRQWFKVLELLGYDVCCEHVYFGLIVMPEGKMSTRKGRVIFLEDVIEEAVERAKNVIQERIFSEDRKNEIAKIVGIGAIKYHDLSQNRKKTVTFDWDKMLSLDGNSSPYLQYSYARARSIIRKSGREIKPFNKDYTCHSEEIKLIRKLSRYPEVVRDAATEFYPHFISTYLFELAQQFTAFYSNVSVLCADNDSCVNNRLILVDFFSVVMKSGLGLLGIDVLEEM